MATMVLTIYGDDRAGLVDSLSEVIAKHGGNWDKSYLAELAGKFAGVVMVSVVDSKVAAVRAGLEPLCRDGLEITVHEVDDQPETQAHRELSLELVGPDHPGIIHDISHALAGSGVSIAELSTETSDSPMGGGMLFRARALLHSPYELSASDLLASLEPLANEMMVHIEISADVAT
ncbi:MAG: amino acid-binding ACT protein [bacterium]|nr:amino acid-binding ACT protein [bacterium]